MPSRQTLPAVWLLTDARNDARLARALVGLPPRSGVIFRHYHLSPTARRKRFAALARLARAHGHAVVLAGTARDARALGADGAYGPPDRLARGPATLRLVTAHSLREMRRAVAARADALVLSPVFPTRSHPGGRTLGPVAFNLMSRLSPVPVIALGGMTQRRARTIGARNWAAIDGI